MTTCKHLNGTGIINISISETIKDEVTEINRVLTDNGFEIKDRLMDSDCDLYICQRNGLRLAIYASIDGDGRTICVEDEQTLECLESGFADR